MDMAEKMCDTIFMIFKGKKVLDGSLSSIQSEYAVDLVRVQFDDSSAGLPALPGVSNVVSNGPFYEFQIDDIDQSQQILNQLSQHSPLTHFEIVKPSLHDIFVQIARPEPNHQPAI